MSFLNVNPDNGDNAFKSVTDFEVGREAEDVWKQGFLHGSRLAERITSRALVLMVWRAASI